MSDDENRDVSNRSLNEAFAFLKRHGICDDVVALDLAATLDSVFKEGTECGEAAKLIEQAIRNKKLMDNGR